MRRIRLWDLPTRLFHWSLVAAVAALLISGEIGGNLMIWHGRIGIFVIGLLAFRLVWGFAGSTYARFAQFFPTPAAIRAYLTGRWQGVGHNPLGALSVFALLAVLALQGATGLFANDDIAFTGPLYPLVNATVSEILTKLHHKGGDALTFLAGLHVAAVLFYTHVRKDNLVKPMINGWKDADSGESASGGGIVALVFALAMAALAVWGASGSWLPPPPPAVVETPAW